MPAVPSGVPTMPPEAAIMEHFLRLQTSLHGIADEEGLAEATVRGLEGLPGVSGCFACIPETVSRPPERDAARRRFPLRTARSEYGALFLEVADGEAFEPYSPFVANTADLVALRIENSRDAKAIADAERRLSHSRELTRYIIEHMRGAVAVYDRDMRYLYVSRRYLEDYLVKEKDIIGRRHYEVFPDLPEKWREAHRRALAGEASSGEDDRYIREDGAEFWTEWECRPWYEADGSVGGIVVYTEVVNERKRTMEALEEEATRRRVLIEQSRDGIVVLDEAGKVYEANRRFAEMLGYSQEEVRRLQVWDWEHVASRERILEMIRDVDETGDHFETVHRRRDGTLYDVEISTNAAVIGGRKLIFCVCRDISGRKRAEESLRESEARLRAIFDSARDFIYLKDTDLRYTHCNKAMTEMFGRPREEIIGRTAADLYGEEYREAIDGVDRRVLSGEPVIGTYVRTVRGATRVISTSKSPVYDAAGKVVGLCGVSRDITEEVRIREQMRQAQKVEAIGRLAGGVAHDLNNMLSPVIGYGELLLEEMDPMDARRESVHQILRAAARARDLVRQLLAFSRKQTMEFRPVDINETVKGFERLLRRTLPEDIDIELALSPDMPPAYADVVQVEQILMNLAVNAADAMPGGGRLTIATALTELDEAHAASRRDMKPGRYVKLSVRDTGCGMDKETLEQVFEPFFSTKGERGTGLGLATVYGIVKQHGGSIWVYSEPGKGAVFNIYLPVAGAAAAAEGGGREAPTDLAGTETVLLVEDNDQVRNLAREVLRRQGYTVLSAKDGIEALNLAESHDGPVHLLLTDVVMPGMNGRELYARAAVLRPGLKVLFMSGYPEDVIAHRGVLDEGVRFVQKPFSVQSLAAKVRETLGRP
jgi:PAS domain S-box-containing protein